MRNSFKCNHFPMADFQHVYDAPPEGANADWTIAQNWEKFGADEHAMWDRLFARQSEMLPGRAADAFLRGMDVLKLSKPGIPDYRELNARLTAATGWQVVAVPGLVPDAVFFRSPRQPAFSCRQFHPYARAARLFAGTRCFS